MKNAQLTTLKAKIKGFEIEARYINNRIARSTGERKAEWWNEKRRLGQCARAHFLAYALLRGFPRTRVETRVNKHNPIYHSLILEVVLTTLPYSREKHSVLSVITWLDNQTPE